MSEQLDQWRQQFAENAGIDQPATEAPAEPADTAPDEQPRDEKGQYAPKDSSVSEPEPAEAEQPDDTGTDAPEPEVGETDDELAKYLAKYGGDTDKALRAAVEAQKLIGRQGSELGQIRQELAERFDALEAKVADAPVQPAYSPDDVQQFLDENPALAPQLAQRAKELGDDSLYARAMATWAEVDAAGAMDYAGRIAAWESGNQIRQEFAPILSQAQANANAQAVTAAVEQTAAKHQDFAQVIDAVTPDVLNSLHPSILQDLRNGDAVSKASALETLYYAARGVQSERQPQAQAAAAANAQQTARQARTDAAVGTTTQGNPAPRDAPASNIDAWRDQLHASPEFRKAAGLT